MNENSRLPVMKPSFTVACRDVIVRRGSIPVLWILGRFNCVKIQLGSRDRGRFLIRSTDINRFFYMSMQINTTFHVSLIIMAFTTHDLFYRRRNLNGEKTWLKKNWNNFFKGRIFSPLIYDANTSIVMYFYRSQSSNTLYYSILYSKAKHDNSILLNFETIICVIF